MLIAIAAGYACGLSFALAARHALLRSHFASRTRYCAVAALYGATALGPAALLLYSLFPDWCLLYLANPAHLPSVVMWPLIFGVVAGSPIAGFLVTHRLLVLDNRRGLLLSMAAPPIFVAFLLVIARSRLGLVAYYDVFHTHAGAISLADSPLVIALPIITIALIGLLVFAILRVREHVELVRNVPEREPLESPVDPEADPNLAA